MARSEPCPHGGRCKEIASLAQLVGEVASAPPPGGGGGGVPIRHPAVLPGCGRSGSALWARRATVRRFISSRWPGLLLDAITRRRAFAGPG